MRLNSILKLILMSIVFMLGAVYSHSVLSETKTELNYRPAVLTLMNREIAIFRAPLNGASPEVRVDNASKRVQQVEIKELTEEIKALPFTLAGEKGFQFHLGTRHLFSLIEKDIDPESGEDMALVVTKTVEILNELKTAKYQQTKLSFMLHEAFIVLLATIALIVAILVIRRALNWLSQFLLLKCQQFSDCSPP